MNRTTLSPDRVAELLEACSRSTYFCSGAEFYEQREVQQWVPPSLQLWRTCTWSAGLSHFIACTATAGGHHLHRRVSVHRLLPGLYWLLKRTLASQRWLLATVGQEESFAGVFTTATPTFVHVAPCMGVGQSLGLPAPTALNPLRNGRLSCTLHAWSYSTMQSTSSALLPLPCKTMHGSPYTFSL